MLSAGHDSHGQMAMIVRYCCIGMLCLRVHFGQKPHVAALPSKQGLVRFAPPGVKIPSTYAHGEPNMPVDDQSPSCLPQNVEAQ